MQRIFMSLTMALVCFWAASSPVVESMGRAPSGTVTIQATRVGVGLGFTWGDGYLRYKGDDYKFKVSGLNAVGVGITKLKAVGDVHDLRSLNDFPGNYVGFEGGGTFIEGSEGLVVKNSKGVVINLRAEQSGMELKLGNEGLKISPAWD